MSNQTIHPEYNTGVNVQCICWNKFTVSSTVQGPIKIESCPKCHPTYTGKKETRVAKWRIEKFKEKQKKIEAMQAKQKNK